MSTVGEVRSAGETEDIDRPGRDYLPGFSQYTGGSMRAVGKSGSITDARTQPNSWYRRVFELDIEKLPGCILLGLLCLMLYLPGISKIPPIDRDEARFAEATRQMIETGDFVHPRFMEQTRLQKPIGIYWLQAASVMGTGGRPLNRIWAYRLPSVAGAIIAVLLTYWIGRRLLDAESAFLGAAFLAASTLMVTEALLARTDALLLASTVGALGCLAVIYTSGRKGEKAASRYAAGFWVSLGFGMLIKGPVLPAIAGLTLISLWIADLPEARDRNRYVWVKALRSSWGVPLMLTIVMPWVIAIDRATDGGFLRQSFGRDILPKLVGGQEGHGAPPGYYTLLAAIFFWPGSLFAVAGPVLAFKRRLQPAQSFLLCWLVPSWIAFEIAPTKLPHYVLPMYPALALLTAQAVTAPITGGVLKKIFRIQPIGWFLITIAAAAMAVAGPIVLGEHAGAANIATASAVAILAWTTLVLCRRKHLKNAAAAAILTAVALFIPLREWLLPNLEPIWLSQRAFAAVAEQEPAAAGSRPVVVVGYEEPSLVFLLSSKVRFVSPENAVRFLQDDLRGLVLINEKWVPPFRAQAQRAGLEVARLWSGTGLNYSKGRRITVVLFGRNSTQPAPTVPNRPMPTR